MEFTNSQKAEVVREATKLKRYLRKSQKDRLIYSEFNPLSCHKCIYGLIYGNSRNIKAYKTKIRFGLLTSVEGSLGTFMEHYLINEPLSRRPIFDYIKSDCGEFILQL